MLSVEIVGIVSCSIPQDDFTIGIKQYYSREMTLCNMDNRARSLYIWCLRKNKAWKDFIGGLERQAWGSYGQGLSLICEASVIVQNTQK